MTNSQNGWPINPDMTTLIVDGVSFGGVRTGDVFTVLRYVATRYGREVGRLKAGQCGGYNPRSIAGSGVPSNHASATAIDINWTDNPEHKRTMTAAERAACHAIVSACDGVVRWGGDYAGSDVDEMHWEINKPAAAVAVLARKIEGDMEPVDVWNVAWGKDDRRETAGDKLIHVDTSVDSIAAQSRSNGSGISNLGSVVAALSTKVDALEAKLDQVLAALTPPAAG